MTDGAHVERVKAELRELDDRITKLHAFITGNPIFGHVSAIKQELLRAQHSAMESYRTILALRLSLEEAAA